MSASLSFDAADAIVVGLWFGMACATAVAASVKNRSAVAWLLASLLAPGIALIRVLLVRTKQAGEPPDWTTLSLVMAAAPLLVATVGVYIGSLSDRSPEYWFVAPWFIIMALPVSAAMLALVGLLYWMAGSGRPAAAAGKAPAAAVNSRPPAAPAPRTNARPSPPPPR